jgi:hypothetical protein
MRAQATAICNGLDIITGAAITTKMTRMNQADMKTNIAPICITSMELDYEIQSKAIFAALKKPSITQRNAVHSSEPFYSLHMILWKRKLGFM